MGRIQITDLNPLSTLTDTDLIIVQDSSGTKKMTVANLKTSFASYKNGSGTFTSGGTTYTVTDSFITANTQVIVSPTSEKQGSWSVESASGSFTITSDATETVNVTFDWGAVK